MPQRLATHSVTVQAPAHSAEDVRAYEPIRSYGLAHQRNGNKREKIWIDLDNSPHVPFFAPIIEELQSAGAEVMLTARNMYQVCELLEFFNIPCKVVGGHYGRNKILKVLCNCLRAAELLP